MSPEAGERLGSLEGEVPVVAPEGEVELATPDDESERLDSVEEEEGVRVVSLDSGVLLKAISGLLLPAPVVVDADVLLSLEVLKGVVDVVSATREDELSVLVSAVAAEGAPPASKVGLVVVLDTCSLAKSERNSVDPIASASCVLTSNFENGTR